MTHFETGLAENLLRVGLNVSVRGAVMGGLAWAVLRAVRVKAAAVHHAAWTAVLLAMLLMPLLRTTLPPLRLPRLPLPIALSTPVPPALDVAKVGAERMTTNTTAGLELVPAGTRSITSQWPVMLLALYLAGALLFVVRNSIGYFLACTLVRKSRLLGAADGIMLNRWFAPGAQIPDLRVSSLARVPIVAGVLQPSIILPADWSAWNEEKLAAVLEHELSHVRRWDPLVRFLSSFNKCLYWFHPLAWWLERHLSELAEQVSDDLALVTIADRRKYAEILLGFAARASEGAGRVRWSTLAMASPSHLGSRIERILSNRHASAGRLGRRTLVILLLAAPLAAVSTAAVELASREQATSPRSGPVSSTPTIEPQSFAGTWQGVWRDTWISMESSLSVTLRVSAVNGKLTGATSSTVQSRLVQRQPPARSLDGWPPTPPPPRPPTPPPPPTGTMLNPRVEGRTLSFKVKAPDAKLMEFRLTLQADDTGALTVNAPTHTEFYPAFEMKRMH